jgi:voltage-gated potassium channel Kch
MKALRQNAPYGPDALKAISQAFDEAWSAIAGNFSGEATEAARLRLADALLSVASDDSRDVEALKISALAAMAVDYKGVRRKISY